MMRPHERIIEARLRIGRSPDQVAVASGVPLASYYDLESSDDDIQSAISLRDLRRVCKVLEIRLYDLFCYSPDSGSADQAGGFTAFADQLRRYLQESGKAQVDLEEEAGWEIGKFMEHPETAWDWTLDCLTDVCNAAGADWKLVLARL